MTYTILGIAIIILVIAYITKADSAKSSYARGIEDGQKALDENVIERISRIENLLKRSEDAIDNADKNLQEAYMCGIEHATLYSYLNQCECRSAAEVYSLMNSVLDDVNNGKYDKSLHRLRVSSLYEELTTHNKEEGNAETTAGRPQAGHTDPN